MLWQLSQLLNNQALNTLQFHYKSKGRGFQGAELGQRLPGDA